MKESLKPSLIRQLGISNSNSQSSKSKQIKDINDPKNNNKENRLISLADLNGRNYSALKNKEPELKNFNINNDNNNQVFGSRNRTQTTFSINSQNSRMTDKTLESIPFKEEKDLDLPNFSSTKYKSLAWRVFHSLCHFFFAIFLASSTFFYFKKRFDRYNILLTVSNSFFFISSFTEWLHYHRGCLGWANLNSPIKNNIDKSFRAKILRSEYGWKYFISCIGGAMLIFGNVYYFFLSFNDGSEFPDDEFWNYNFIAMMVLSLSEILKIEKILTENRQYVVKNDLSNCLIEIYWFFATLMFGSSYLVQVLFYTEYEEILFIKIVIMTCRISGSILALISSFTLQHRYYLSSYDDLNISDLSNITI